MLVIQYAYKQVTGSEGVVTVPLHIMLELKKKRL